MAMRPRRRKERDGHAEDMLTEDMVRTCGEGDGDTESSSRSCMCDCEHGRASGVCPVCAYGFERDSAELLCAHITGHGNRYRTARY